MDRKEIVRVMKEQYPGYDKFLHSKAENPSKYGICRTKEAESYLKSIFGECYAEKAVRGRRRDGHKLTCRISARMTNERYDELQRYITADGFTTTQSFLEWLVNLYIQGKVK